MELFEHQKIGVEFLREKERAILADEMGLGKTLQAIVAAGESPKALVICPASLKINWKREIERQAPDDKVAILSTTEPDPIKPCDWYIINYDIAEKKLDAIEALIDAGRIDTLILDEAHYIKGKSIRAAVIAGGQVTKAEVKVKYPGIAKKMRRVYCLTGTPLLNRPIEMFNLLRAVGHPISKNRATFATRYCGAFWMVMVRDNSTGRQFLVPNMEKAYKYYGDRSKYTHLYRFPNENGASNLDELARLLKDTMLRRKKKDVLDLPEKIISVMDCELTDEWRKKYLSAWDEYLEFVQSNPLPEGKLDNILMARQLVELGKLKQVASRSKVARMAEDIRNAVEQGEKVIVFSQFTETIDMISIALSEKSPGRDPVKHVTLTGADDMDERQDAVDAFQKDAETKAIVANIKAGGVGLTLTEASIVMFADMDWSPEIHAQAEDRAHRIGQEGTVNVYYYVAEDTVEEDIVAILNAKKGIMNQVLEGNKKRVKSESMQEAFLKLMAKKVSHRG